jgi:hypothetical protein
MLPSLRQSVCNHLQRQTYSMEIMDAVDAHTPTGGGTKDILPPDIPGISCGHYIDINRT